MFNRSALYDGKNFSGWRSFLQSIIFEDTTGVILFVGGNTSFFVYEDLYPILEEFDIPICGGIFPGVIYNDKIFTNAVLGISFNTPIEVLAVEEVQNFQGNLLNSQCYDSAHTCLILVDGLATGIGNFLEKIFASSNFNVKFIGGGTGNFELKKTPSLFTKSDFWAGGTLIITINTPIGIGVQHGWQTTHGPIIANSTNDNNIYELNWQPAYDYYKDIVEQRINQTLNKGNFLNFSKEYPFGMIRSDGSLVVRDPISIYNNTGLRLVGEVPQNSVLMVLQGTIMSLIKSAGQAVKDAEEDFLNDCPYSKEPKNMLIIDCMSRALFLQDNIDKEIYTIRKNSKHGLRAIGFLSLGEIASLGDRYLEFFNKTVVIGVG